MQSPLSRKEYFGFLLSEPVVFEVVHRAPFTKSDPSERPTEQGKYKDHVKTEVDFPPAVTMIHRALDIVVVIVPALAMSSDTDEWIITGIIGSFIVAITLGMRE